MSEHRAQFDAIVDMFDHIAGHWSERTAMISGDQSLSYRAYRFAAGVLAERLWDLGVGRGDRVAVFKGNSVELSIAAQAIWAAGAQTVLFNPLYTARELGPLLLDAAPAVLLCDDALMDLAAPLAAEAGISALAFAADDLTSERGDESTDRPLPGPRPGPDDAASLVYTGGTTGLPKGARHLHSGIVETTRQIDWAWVEKPGGHIWLDVAPQFHIWGLCMTALVPTYARDTLVLIKEFQPAQVLDAMARHKVTMFAGGPAPIFHALMGQPEFRGTDFSSLRLVGGGGSPFAFETFRAWEAVTGCSINQGLGMSEAAPLALNPRHDENRLGTCGPPCPGTEIEVVDLATGNTILPQGEDGEFRVRGPQMMQGYWRRPEETAHTMREGWIYTGDIGHLDEAGYVVIVDRKKEMAIVNGYNVFPREIDEVLFAHADIQEAAAVGTPSDKTGEVIHAYVVPREGAALTEAEVIGHCQQNLAPYKVPAMVIVVDQLPKTPAAKIDKMELRQRSLDA